LKPKSSKFIVYDSSAEGFGVAVYPSGRMSYVLRTTYTDPAGRSKQRLDTIGAVADLDVEEARDQANARRRMYRQGVDARAEEQRLRDQGLTLAEAFAAFASARGRILKPRTLTVMGDSLRRSYGHLLNKPIIQITDEDVIKAYRKRATAAPTNAAAEARYLRSIWNWIREDRPALELGPCPITRLNRLREMPTPRRRTGRLTAETAPAWWQETQRLIEDGNRFGFMSLFVFYTGCRISEATGLRWEDTVLDGHVPHAVFRDTKTREDVEVPLPHQVVALLKAWQELAPPVPYVFAGVSRTGEIIPASRPSKELAAHRERCGVRWSPHDLRRTYITTGELGGTPSIICRRLTGHKAGANDAHGGYIISAVEDLAPHAQRIADLLEQMACPRPNVVPMVRRAGA
jgi:integrase